MLETERQKLFDPKREYLQLGISEGGVHYNTTAVVWVNTVSAYNMRCPNVSIAPEDLQDKEIFDRICSLKVIGLYIYAPLDDYSFISRFPDLMDLCIRCAHKLKNLDFLKDTPDLGMLFLDGATLPDLDIIWKVKASGGGFLPFRCVGLFNCNIGRATEPFKPSQRFTEFLVWSLAENAERDREMWSSVSALTKKYYQIKPREEK